jgi:hypothetical protein
MLGAAAAAIGEDDEATRVIDFLQDSSPSAAKALRQPPGDLDRRNE